MHNKIREESNNKDREMKGNLLIFVIIKQV